MLITSTAAEAVDSVGATFPTHAMFPADSPCVGQVIVKPPPVPWMMRKRKLPGPAGAVKVTVQEAVSVIACFWPLLKLMACVPEPKLLAYSWSNVTVCAFCSS